jgi:hypothetical protein
MNYVIRLPLCLRLKGKTEISRRLNINLTKEEEGAAAEEYGENYSI